MNRHDSEALSAHLDGQLNAAEQASWETRLRSDAAMRRAFEDLRATRELVRALPPRRTPRNFTLTRLMVSRKPPLPAAYPLFQFASAVATALLVVTWGANVLAPRLSRAPAAAVYGVGGGGGGGPESFAAEAAELPAPDLSGPPAAPSLELGQDAARLQATPQPKASELENRLPATTEPIAAPMILRGWQTALLVAAAGFWLAAFSIKRLVVARWRR